MGWAEFEFGAVPTSFVEMSKREDIVTDSVTVVGKPHDVCVEPAAYAKVPEREATVQLLAPLEFMEPLKNYLREMVKDRFAFRHQALPQYDEGLFGKVLHKRGAGNRKLKALEYETGYASMWFDLGLLGVAGVDPLQMQYLKVLLGK